jgi:hypothetical protein
MYTDLPRCFPHKLFGHVVPYGGHCQHPEDLALMDDAAGSSLGQVLEKFGLEMADGMCENRHGAHRLAVVVVNHFMFA